MALKAPPNAAELTQGLGNRGIVNPQLIGNGNSGQRVLHVVPTGQIEGNGERRRIALPLDLERHGGAVSLYIDRAHLSVTRKTVGNDRLRYERNDFAYMTIIHTEHRGTVERQVLQESDKGLPQAREIVLISLHVVSIDIGDDRHDRLQVQKRGIRFIGFDHNEFARPETGV